MVGFQNDRIVGIITACVQNIKMPVFIEINYIKITGAIDSGKPQQGINLKPEVATVGKQADLFVALGKLSQHIG